MKATILALIIGSLVLAEVASAADPIVPLNTWLTWAENNLTTPAYSSGWGFAFANATNFDPCTGTCVDKFSPYTVAAVIISPDTEAINTRRDPSASLNITVQAVAALGNGNITTGAIKDGSQDFAAYAAAVGSANIKATGVNTAMTIAAFDIGHTAVVNPDVSTSEVSGFASSAGDSSFVMPPPT